MSRRGKSVTETRVPRWGRGGDPHGVGGGGDPRDRGRGGNPRDRNREGDERNRGRGGDPRDWGCGGRTQRSRHDLVGYPFVGNPVVVSVLSL